MFIRISTHKHQILTQANVKSKISLYLKFNFAEYHKHLTYHKVRLNTKFRITLFIYYNYLKINFL